MFAGHIKVLDGLHMARGPDVAQALSRIIFKKNWINGKEKGANKRVGESRMKWPLNIEK